MAKGKKTGGRKAGTPNRATANAREAIARLVEGNVERLQDWLDEIAKDEGARSAWGCFMDVLEFHQPKLARTETKVEGEIALVPRLTIKRRD
jgi:vacuolar-type H+-ATPase subunit E/Vma4